VLYKFTTNTLYLYNDDGSALSAGIIPGSTAQVNNTQCTLSGAGSSRSTSGNNLTLNVALSFSSSFTGGLKSYIYVQGNNGLNSGPGWTQKGTWTATTQPPVVDSLTPNSGSGTTQTFTVVVTDPGGIPDLNQVQLMFNTAPTRASACNVNYKPSTNTMYLYNDDGSAFIGAVVPGSGSASNSQCTLNGVSSSYSISGNDLTLNVSVTFSSTFIGNLNSYVYVQGNNGLNNGGWVQWGGWTH
jgi:hypothetical protein